MSNVCKHGRLARKCPDCECVSLEEELAASQERINVLEDVLRPFAAEFALWDGVGCWDSMTLDEMFSHAPGETAGVTFADLRRAAVALKEQP